MNSTSTSTSTSTWAGRVFRIAAAVFAASALTLAGAGSSTADTPPPASASPSVSSSVPASSASSPTADLVAESGTALASGAQAVYTRRLRSVATGLCIDDSNQGLRHFGCQDQSGPYANYQRFRLDTY